MVLLLLSLVPLIPPYEQRLIAVVVRGCLIRYGSCYIIVPVVVGSSLSTRDPPCEQGLVTVVVGVGWLRCPIIVVAIVVF